MSSFARLASFVFAVVVALLLPIGVPVVAAFETQAREAILVDLETNSVIFEKNPDVRMPPASMSKIMTVYMVFERLKSGRLALDDKLPVSEKAWRMGGSKMFVEVGNEVSVEDLLRGVIVQSGNDACIVLAEGLSGSEEAFAREMSERGREIGLRDSNFTNSTGWPDPDHYMSARDLAILAERLIEDHPEYYHYFSELEFTWHDIRQMNRNPLLYKNLGVDGLKTGHTEEAGYGLAASAKREGRRLLLVVTGLPSLQVRSEEAERLLNFGYREFGLFTLLKAGDAVDSAEVWLGEEGSVPIVVEGDLRVTLPHAARDQIKASVVYDGPVEAPVSQGQQIGILRIEAPGMTAMEFPLRAARDVKRLGPLGRLIAMIKHLALGS